MVCRICWHKWGLSFYKVDKHIAVKKQNRRPSRELRSSVIWLSISSLERDPAGLKFIIQSAVLTVFEDDFLCNNFRYSDSHKTTAAGRLFLRIWTGPKASASSMATIPRRLRSTALRVFIGILVFCLWSLVCKKNIKSFAHFFYKELLWEFQVRGIFDCDWWIVNTPVLTLSEFSFSVCICMAQKARFCCFLVLFLIL